MSLTKTLPERVLAITIFSSRWLQAPLYLGLIVAQAIYVQRFVREVWHLLTSVKIYGEQEIMLVVLGLIDVVMISNLLIMVIIGGYETFVTRLGMDNHPDLPEWLDHVNANTMKIKLAMALIGISSIHLLKTFIHSAKIQEGIMKLHEVITKPQEVIMEVEKRIVEMSDATLRAYESTLKMHESSLLSQQASMKWQVIHITFLISALALAYTAKLSQQSLDAANANKH
jgi:uncharacterized protein (TIGR00645 family)